MRLRRRRPDAEVELPAATHNHRAIQEWRARNREIRTFQTHPHDMPLWTGLSLPVREDDDRAAAECAEAFEQRPKPSWWKAYLPRDWGRR